MLGQFIEEVYLLASQARSEGEVPVASMILEKVDSTYRFLCSSTNRIVTQADATSHAEMNCIKEACRIKKNERLIDCIMITTLEPCLMCTGAIILARLSRVYYFAPSMKGIGMSKIVNNPELNKGLNHKTELIFLEEEFPRASQMISSFFLAKRQNIQNSLTDRASGKQ